MKSRLLLHLGLSIIAILMSNSLSIYPFIILISLICTVAACRNTSDNFDTIDMFWLLYQLSFVVAPAIMFKEYQGDFLFTLGVIVDYDFGQISFKSEHVLLLFFILISIALINLFLLPSSIKVLSLVDYELKTNFFILLILAYAAFFLNVYLNGGIENILASRFGRDRDIDSVFSIFSTSLLLVSIWLATIKFKDFSLFLKILLIIPLMLPFIISFNPFNSARFFIIQAWLPFVFILYPRLRRFSFFMIVLSVSMIVIMPIFSLTTRHGFDAEINNIELTPTGFISFLDQSKVAIYLIDMVDRTGFQLGSSILSVIGFFVPRSFWPDKPSVVGLVVGDELYNRGLVGTPNLSGPIFLDFYYDFGVIGVLFGSVVLALLCRRFLSTSNRINGVPIVEYIILAALPILFRGSVGAVIGIVFFSLIFYYLLLHLFCTRKV